MLKKELQEARNAESYDFQMIERTVTDGGFDLRRQLFLCQNELNSLKMKDSL